MKVTINVNEKIQSGQVVAAKGGESQLGYIFWYSISSDVEVTRLELQQKFQSIGIDESWLPNEIRPSDAFRRATKEIQRKKIPTSDPNKLKNILVREVYSGFDMIQRNIVIEIVDRSGKRLEYDANGAKLSLIKKTNDFTITIINDEVREIAKEAKTKFIKYVDYYSAQQLRVMISRYLASLAPTAVRPNGGVYFVPQSFAIELKKLQSLCVSLNSEGVAIPLYDTSDNRNLVLTKLENEMKEVLDRCRELEKTDNLKKQFYQDSIEEARKLAKTYKEYKKLLSLDISKLENLLDDLRLSAIRLTQKIAEK